MAEVKSFNGSLILIRVGDGGDPETFAHPCLINSTRAIQFTSTTSTTTAPDCADQNAPAWTATEKDALSATISGEGLMAADLTGEYFDWLISADAKNVEVVVNAGGGVDEQTFDGKFHLTNFEVSGARKDRSQVTISLVSDGPVTRTAGT